MTHQRTPEEVEELLGAFTIGEPSVTAEARILHEASLWRRRRRVTLWGCGIAAVAVLGASLAFVAHAPPAPSETQAVLPAAPTVVSAEDLGTLRAEIVEMKEMCEVIPPEKEATKREIDAKLSACLERLTYLEQRLMQGRENSSLLLPDCDVVNV